MSFLKRAHDIVQAKANRALDAAENPAEILDLNYEQMLEQITKVRAALVQIAAARKQLELQEEQFKHTIDHLDQQAAQAVQLGRDDLAREALSRKAAAQQQVETLEPQHQQLAEQEPAHPSAAPGRRHVDRVLDGRRVAGPRAVGRNRREAGDLSSLDRDDRRVRPRVLEDPLALRREPAGHEVESGGGVEHLFVVDGAQHLGIGQPGQAHQHGRRLACGSATASGCRGRYHGGPGPLSSVGRAQPW
jgi:hypothetical protein